MANIKITDKQWTDAKEYFEAGLSLSQINERTTIDKAAISRKAKAEGWIKGGEKQQLLLDAVRLEEAKSTLNQQALTIHNELVDERTKHILFFNNAAITNVKQAMAEPCENQNDFRARAETINKGREAVLGKTPDTAVQVNTQINEIRRVIVKP